MKHYFCNCEKYCKGHRKKVSRSSYQRHALFRKPEFTDAFVTYFRKVKAIPSARCSATTCRAAFGPQRTCGGGQGHDAGTVSGQLGTLRNNFGGIVVGDPTDIGQSSGANYDQADRDLPAHNESAEHDVCLLYTVQY